MLKIKTFKEKIQNYFASKKALQEQIDVMSANLHIANIQVRTLTSEKEALKASSDATLAFERAKYEALKKARYTVDFSAVDPSPSDSIKRVDYINQVLSFFDNIFSKKIEQFIARAHADLQNPLNLREYDLQVKGVINAFSQILDWRDDLMGEKNQAIQDELNENDN